MRTVLLILGGLVAGAILWFLAGPTAPPDETTIETPAPDAEPALEE